MPRFFLSNEQCSEFGLCGKNSESGCKIEVRGNDAEHISRSLRMRVGDEILMCDPSGTEYICGISEVFSDRVELSLRYAKEADTEPPYYAVLYQALPKASKFDVIVQKAVELGVSRIVPVLTERCISRPDDESMEKKIRRWQKISEEAAKQCGRGIIPQVSAEMSYSRALEDAAEGELACLCYEGGGTELLGRVLSESGSARDYRFIIGAEGGFSEKEADAAREKGLRLVNLGKRILRCETAGPFALGCLCCEKELK